MSTRKSDQLPLPEAIDGKVWEIIDSPHSSYVNPTKRTMAINMSDDPQWRLVRAHELAHIAFTPPGAMRTLPAGVSWETLQACEDCRINARMHAAGIDTSAGSPQAVIDRAMKAAAGDVKLSALLTLASFHEERSARWAELYHAIPETMPRARFQDIVSYAVPKLTASSATFDTTIKIARWIEDQLSGRADTKKPARKRVKTEGAETALLKPHTKPFLPEDWRDLASGSKVEKAAASAEGNSGTATLVYPDLLLPAAARSRGGVRCADEGALLRAPWRITTDQKLFRQTSVTPTGSVLIDVSGSMHLTPDDVRKFVELIPAGIIATYSGSDDSGNITIVAHKGRMAISEQAYETMGGNVIDLPALVWLSTQPRPRYWICDGAVTGIGDSSYDTITRACHTIRESAQIRQFQTPHGLVSYLQETKRMLTPKGAYHGA